MKNWNWKQWAAFGVIIASIIALVVLHFKQPEVSYAFTEAMTAGGLAVGFLGGFFIKGHVKVEK